MSQFIEYLEGTFANKRQAQTHPTRYAHIRISHRKIGENRFYGEQAYNYALNRPYRQFVLDVIEEEPDRKYRLKNYEVKNPSKFVECKNIDQITDDDLIPRDGCDVVFERSHERSFRGKIDSCECWVDWRGTKTYLRNDIMLTDTEYWVVDEGLDATTNEKVWGSDWGHLKFARL